MKANQKVKISKLKAVENPEVETASWEEYRPGSGDNDKSPPVDYTTEGLLLKDIKVGSIMHMLRHKRNDVEVPGIFMSSPVQKIEDNKVYTANSVYLVENL